MTSIPDTGSTPEQSDTGAALLLVPQRPALARGQDSTFHVLVRAQAPDVNPRRSGDRPPYHLALVIDRSGSMRGAPLAEAIRCARYIVDQLEPRDRAAIVAFDDEVSTMLPLSAVGDRSAARRALSAIVCGGTTALHAGWRAGAEALLPEAGGAALSRVILLSDGQANEGLNEPDAIARQAAEVAGAGVSTSTYGLGRHFNEALMVGMANGGGGNPYYGETAADLFDPFNEEFELISNLYGRGMLLTLHAASGVRLRVVNDLPAVECSEFPAWRLPDLAYQAEAWALVEVTVPASRAGGDAVEVLKAEVSGASLEGGPLSLPDAMLILPVVTAAEAEALPDEELVRRRMQELGAATRLLAAREAANNHQWDEVDRILAAAQSEFSGNEWLAAVLDDLRAIARARDHVMLSKSAMYSAGKMERRLAEKLENLRDSEQTAVYARRKPSQGKGA